MLGVVLIVVSLVLVVDFYFGFWFWLLIWFSVVVDVCMVAKPH